MTPCNTMGPGIIPTSVLLVYYDTYDSTIAIRVLVVVGGKGDILRDFWYYLICNQRMSGGDMDYATYEVEMKLGGWFGKGAV